MKPTMFLLTTALFSFVITSFSPSSAHTAGCAVTQERFLANQCPQRLQFPGSLTGVARSNIRTPPVACDVEIS